MTTPRIEPPVFMLGNVVRETQVDVGPLRRSETVSLTFHAVSETTGTDGLPLLTGEGSFTLVMATDGGFELGQRYRLALVTAEPAAEPSPAPQDG